MVYARIINGLVVAWSTDETFQSIDASVKALWTKVPEEVRDGWRKVSGAWTSPPETPPEAPADYYLAKVTFERRFDDAAFAALDGLRIAVRNRPADWAVTTDQAWVDMRPYIRALADYDAADRINVMDPAVGGLLRGLQAEREVFGEDDTAAEAVIAAILSPFPLSGEPLA